MSATEQVIGHCGQCGKAIPGNHPYAWCAACGTSLPRDVKAKLAELNPPPPRPSAPPRDQGVPLMVEGTPVACPICRHDRYRMKERFMPETAGFFDVEWINPSAETYICLRCGHVMWFVR